MSGLPFTAVETGDNLCISMSESCQRMLLSGDQLLVTKLKDFVSQ